jgi:hypothetical protein
MSQENLELVGRGLDAYQRWVSSRRSRSEGTLRSPTGWPTSLNPGREWRLEPGEIREVGERVLVRTMVRARGRGSSVELTADAGMVFECQDCRIMRFWSYLNWHEALEAVGLSE